VPGRGAGGVARARCAPDGGRRADATPCAASRRARQRMRVSLAGIGTSMRCRLHSRNVASRDARAPLYWPCPGSAANFERIGNGMSYKALLAHVF